MRLRAGTPAVRGADVPVRSGQGWAAASASSGTPPPLSLLRLVLRTQPRSGRKSDGASAGSTAGELLCGTRSRASGPGATTYPAARNPEFNPGWRLTNEKAAGSYNNRSQPSSFWETLAPDEYPFESNVNPKMPHPRWSQVTERLIDTGDRVRTQPFNGYGPYVAKLYQRL